MPINCLARRTWRHSKIHVTCHVCDAAFTACMLTPTTTPEFSTCETHKPFAFSYPYLCRVNHFCLAVGIGHEGTLAFCLYTYAKMRVTLLYFFTVAFKQTGPFSFHVCHVSMLCRSTIMPDFKSTLQVLQIYIPRCGFRRVHLRQYLRVCGCYFSLPRVCMHMPTFCLLFRGFRHETSRNTSVTG